MNQRRRNWHTVELLREALKLVAEGLKFLDAFAALLLRLL
jgi:hypothetical protein